MKKYLYKNKWRLILALVVGALGAISVVAMAYIIQLLVTAIISGDAKQMVNVGIISAVYVLIDSYMDYAVEIVNERLTQAVILDIRQDVLKGISHLTVKGFYQEPDEYYMNLLTNDMEVVDEEYLKELLSMYNDIWTFVLGLASSLILSPFFSLIMILMSLAPIVLPKLMGEKLQAARKEVSKAQEGYLGRLKEGLQGFLTLKIYQGFAGYLSILNQKGQQIADAKVENTRRQRGVYAISYGLREFVNIFSWVVGGFFVIAGQLEFATFFAVKQLVAYVAYPIQGFSASYTGLVAARFNCDKIMAFIEATNKEDLSQESVQKVQSLILSDVSLEKNGTLILDNINLKFEMGKKYLIVGESGSGKTSLLRTILGMYTPSAGQIVWEGLTPAANGEWPIQNLLGFVQQDTVIFNNNLADNVTLFKQSKDDLSPLLEKVGLNKWRELNQLESGEQMLHQQSISGGEKRRLDIARALYHSRDILIFDEPVAGLDEANRQTIEETILSLKDKMVIYITHQITEEKIADFDCVIKLHEGRVSGLEGKKVLIKSE